MLVKSIKVQVTKPELTMIKRALVRNRKDTLANSLKTNDNNELYLFGFDVEYIQQSLSYYISMLSILQFRKLTACIKLLRRIENIYDTAMPL